MGRCIIPKQHQEATRQTTSQVNPGQIPKKELPWVRFEPTTLRSLGKVIHTELPGKLSRQGLNYTTQGRLVNYCTINLTMLI